MLDAPSPSAPGPQVVHLWFPPDAGVLRFSLRLVSEDGGVISSGEGAATEQVLSTSDVSEPGEYRLELSLLCEGRVLDSSAQQIRVFAPVVFTHVMPRHCARLTRLSAQWLDCDGVVVTADGQPVPGFSAGAQSRPVLHDGGFVRWLRDDGWLRLEADGEVRSLEIDAGSSWVAARDFAVLGADTLVLRTDAGLSRFPFDAGFDHQEPLELCAASSDARGRAVMRCAVPFSVPLAGGAGPGALSACELGPTGVGTCVSHEGGFVQRELGSGLVLTSTEQRLAWVDLISGLNAEAPIAPRVEFRRLSLENLQAGESPLLFPNATAQVLFVRGPSTRWLLAPPATRASSQLAWLSDGGATAWVELP